MRSDQLDHSQSALRAERAGKIETRMISPRKVGDKPFVAIARVWLEFNRRLTQVPPRTLPSTGAMAQVQSKLESIRRRFPIPRAVRRS